MARPTTRTEFSEWCYPLYECSNYEDYYFATERKMRIDGIYEPFVYIIQEIKTGMKYIGSKTAKGCLEADLGTKYFTSSKLVNWTCDEFEILEIIKCVSNHDALILEGLLIEEFNAVFSESYYNQHNRGEKFNSSGKRFGNRHGVNNSFYGKHHSDDTKTRLSLSTKRNFKNEDFREKVSKSWYGSKEFCDKMIEKYGVDNAMKDPEIAKRSGEAQSKTKNDDEWKEKIGVESTRRRLIKMNEVGEDGLTTYQRMGKSISIKNSEHNQRRVNEGTHHYQCGFFAVLKDGTTKKVSKEDYENNKIGPVEEWEFVHPTSNEGKRRRKLNG